MPGRAGYVIAAVVLVAGLVGMALALYCGLSGLSLQRVVVPGSGEIAIDEPGRYTIYHESRSVVDGRVYDVEGVAGLTVELVSAETGETIPLEAPFGDTTYDFGGRSGRGVLAFDVDRSGDYRLSADYPGGSGPETVLAVGGGIGKRIAMTVVGAIASAGGGFVLALAIGIFTFVRRRRARRSVPPAVGHTAAPPG